MTVTHTQVAALPKAELHLHIEGTLEPELALRLAVRNGVLLRQADAAALRRAYAFTDLSSFLDLYYECMAVLRTAEDFADLASAYLVRARADGVTRVEMFFDPQMHIARGVSLETVIGGLQTAAAQSAASGGPQVELIACFLRDRGPADAMRTLEALAGQAGQLLGVGLDSAEVGYPPRTSPPSSTPPAASACTPSRTRGRRARRSTSGRPWTSSAWSGSTTASGAWRTPHCCAAWRRTAPR